jgi:hypothetical protein
MRDIGRQPDRDSGSHGASTAVIIKLTKRERATILAALRRWVSHPAAREADSIATNEGRHKPQEVSTILGSTCSRPCTRLVRERNNLPSCFVRREEMLDRFSRIATTLAPRSASVWNTRYCFELQKPHQLFIGACNKTLSVARRANREGPGITGDFPWHYRRFSLARCPSTQRGRSNNRTPPHR